ncbi:hypothetical protein C8Q74DRAFT_1258921 [Fomes fomentarius]|nr:hypothetical protein C8Q74DRAFT_1258921 [Fomes fomentarius]
MLLLVIKRVVGIQSAIALQPNHSMSSPRAMTEAPAPFNDPDADIVFRSVNGVDCYKIIIAALRPPRCSRGCSSSPPCGTPLTPDREPDGGRGDLRRFARRVTE